MSVFKDESGREWKLRKITRFDIGRLKVDCDFDFSKAMSSWEGFVGELYEDTGEKSVNALWYFCEPQAKELGVTIDDFCRIFTGDVMAEAREALAEEMSFFAPLSAIGGLMKNAKNRREFWAKANRKIDDQVTKRLAELT